jgi:hypothetical protein
MSSESAETLERESEIRLHEPAIAQFRQDILKGNWDSVSNHLNVLGITSEDNLHVCTCFQSILNMIFLLRDNYLTKYHHFFMYA